MFTMEVTRLIERCRQGDADALGELYKAYAQKMRGVCRRYISDEQTVEDVLHDAFVIIFTSFDRLRDVGRAEAWMTAITRNVALKCKERQAAVTMVPLEEAAMVEQQTEQPNVMGLSLEEMMLMIDRLPEGYGQVFRLSVFEGMSHREIADMLDIEPHSSSSQLARAKKMLRKMMRQYWAAVLLLLLVPFTVFMFRNVRKKNEVAKREKTPQVEHPHRATVAQVSSKGSVTPSPYKETNPIPSPSATWERSNITEVAHSDTTTWERSDYAEMAKADSVTTDSVITTDKTEPPHYNIADLFPDKPAAGSDHQKKWTIQLAYSGFGGEQNIYDQPYSYKPYIDPNIQSSPLPDGQPGYVIPSSIDNWSDLAVYLANNSDALSEKAREAIMNIALSNASDATDKTGDNADDKIVRKSLHYMPINLSLALKYKLNNRFGLETGLTYSRLKSEFVIGSNSNTINEQQTIHYLGIPVKLIYNMYSNKAWTLYGSLGVTTEIPVYSPLNTYYYLNGKLEATDKSTLHAPWQWSVGAGLGLQYNLTPSLGIFAEPSLLYYIPTGGNIETYRTEHPFTFTLPIGIRFTW